MDSIFLDNILNHISQGIVLIDSEGTVIAFNSSAERILGVANERVLLKKFQDIFPHDLLGFSVAQALKTQAAPQLFYKSLKNLSPPREVEVSSQLIHSEGGENTRMIITIKDITELRRLQELESRHDRLEELGEMAASLAHEIRNPLGGIEGFAALLCRDLKDLPDKQAMAQQIMEGTQALNHLVSKVLHYTRPMKLQLTMINLTELAKDVLDMAKADKNLSKNIRFIFQEPGEDVILSVDSELLKTALLNLLINAMQAMPQGGELSLRVIAEPEWAKIEVCDTGTGISQENMKKIFSPFFSTKEEGNGLGLPEVKKVIQAHRGTVRVQSQEGQGTTFTLQLPWTH